MEVMALDSKHSWKAAPGCRILLLDGGAVRCDVPKTWIVMPRDNVVLFDQSPPNMRCTLGLSWHRLSPETAAAPLATLLRAGAATETRPVIERGKPHRIIRPPLEMAWLQLRADDAMQRREVCVRMCVARAGQTQAVILFEFLPEDEMKMFPVWQTLLETLRVGEYVVNPVTGEKRETWG